MPFRTVIIPCAQFAVFQWLGNAIKAQPTAKLILYVASEVKLAGRGELGTCIADGESEPQLLPHQIGLDQAIELALGWLYDAAQRHLPTYQPDSVLGFLGGVVKDLT